MNDWFTSKHTANAEASTSSFGIGYYVHRLFNSIRIYFNPVYGSRIDDSEVSVMFKYASYHLSGPICSCDHQDIMWGIYLDYNDERYRAGLDFTCQTCKVRLRIPPDQFGARVLLDTPYPGKPAPKPESDKIVKLAVVPKEEEPSKENKPNE